MKKFTSIILAGISVLLASLVMLYGILYLFPSLMEEYYNPVFRSNSFQTDLLFYVHPFVLSAALYPFWKYTKPTTGSSISKAFTIAVTYGLIAMLPVLLLTFSAINVSAVMVFTWLGYGILQAFMALVVFANREK